MTLTADTRERLKYALTSAAARDELALILDLLTGNAAGTVLTLSSLLAESAADTLTATPGGGQAGALALTKEVNRIATVATANDSVKLPASVAGLTIVIIHHGAKAMQVFGTGTDTINDAVAATGVSQMPNSVCIYVCTTAGQWYCNGLGTGYSGSFETLSSVDSLIALAGGAQAGTPLSFMLNRFITVASAGDSAQLPVSAPGMQITVINAAASNSMNVFGQTGDAIDAGSANAASAVAAGKTATFYCVTAGRWHKLLSA